MTDLSIEARVDAARVASSSASWQDYVQLLKPRVMTLVVFTGFAGLVTAPGSIHPVLALTAILCIAVGAGASGAMNMWYDRDIDAVMARTRQRPLPRGRMAPEDALGFGIILTLGAVAMMGLAVNWLAAAILGFASAFYVFVYTMWLKRRTPQNIVIGGAAGAFPPVIGWVAATGSLDVGAVALFVLIFAWTPPHFWALSLFRSGDYETAGVPMMPVVAGEAATKRQMVAYTILLLPVGLGPCLLGNAGWLYGVGTTVLGALFVLCAFRVLREDGAATGYRAAKQMFGFSIFYLFAVFALLIADSLSSVGAP